MSRYRIRTIKPEQSPLFSVAVTQGPRLSLVGRWYAVVRPTPPPREQLYGGISAQWLEWHWARGLDPFGPPQNRRPLPRALRAAVLGRDGLVCGICGGFVPPLDVHIDHILPVSHGGRDELSNLQVSHSFCNLSKGARMEVVA